MILHFVEHVGHRPVYGAVCSLYLHRVSFYAENRHIHAMLQQFLWVMFDAL